jgi:3-deoxy-manno-octulosonate cytidylyltransferase (CMP-KDO synthetase)
VVNVQGDEPLIEPATVDAAIEPMLADPTLEMSTVSRPIAGVSEFTNPNVVKVVTNAFGDALYFSRAPIPASAASAGQGRVPSAARAHVGLYVYRRDTLLRLAGLPPVALELEESLEQLRALTHGIRIRVVDTHHVAAGVDTAADLERVRSMMMTASRT